MENFFNNPMNQRLRRVQKEFDKWTIENDRNQLKNVRI